PKVALTREAGKNSKLQGLLNEVGVSTLEIPCIAHAEGPDLSELPGALQQECLSYVVITSPEAAKVFLGGWEAAGKPPVSVACVGKATGEALRKGGVQPVFTPSKATGETLAAELPLPSRVTASGATPRVLYPASARALQTLEEGLQNRGFEVQRLDTYNTVPAAWGAVEETDAGCAAVAAFGSPSAVKTWAARVGTERAAAACIGETSARACQAEGWADSQIFYPDKPGIEGWVQAVRDALNAITDASKLRAAAAE
ncbi:unnamed protein product, partial [Discosporangium mesarthrocarpum]